MDGSYNPRATSNYGKSAQADLFTASRVDILDSDSLKIQYNRYYDRYTGRWLIHDPLVYVDRMNLYQHVRNNPLRYGDPSGGDSCSCDVKEGRSHYEEVRTKEQIEERFREFVK